MKVYEAIAACLAELHTGPVFGLIGDANLFMVDDFVRTHGGRYISAANEAGAVLMAVGHAQVTAGIGVATVTHGPALTNTVTALTEGCRVKAPMVLLAGDTPVVARDHVQSIDQREVVKASGAGFVQLRSPATIAEDIALAFRMAELERRPVVLNMPLEFSWLDTTVTPIRPYQANAPYLTLEGTEFDNAIGIIAAARAPIILAGRGATAPEHRAALIRLAERMGAPLATTLRGRDLFRGEPFNLGIFGTLSTAVAIDAIIACDCVVSFGASLNMYTTSHGELLEGKRLVQVDAYGPEIGRNATPDAGLVGDAALLADHILHWLDEAEIAPSGFRTPELATALADWRPEPQFSPLVPDGAIDIRTAMLALNAALPDNRIVVTDAGRFLGEAWTLFPVLHPHDFIYSVGFGGIGAGMAEAIGAAAGAPSRTTVLITGDGGFMLGGLMEFNTAVRHGLNLLVIVCNDGSYGAERVQFCDRQMDPSLSDFQWPDLAPVAESLGGRGITVRTPHHLTIAAEAIRQGGKPLLIDVKLHPDHVPPLPH